MKLIKQNNQDGIKIFLQEDNKYITIFFAGNGDLYWSLNTDNISNNSITITKENYRLYCLFYQLFKDIDEINIFDDEFYKDRIDDKDRYRKYNCSNYNELYNLENNTITWYSDETAHEVSNILKIKKDEETFRIEFYIQPYIDGYDKDFHSDNYIPIRFRNSGSSYEPFNIVFMRMYNNMKEIDDVNDYGHQIHIEEYLYNKVKKLIK